MQEQVWDGKREVHWWTYSIKPFLIDNDDMLPQNELLLWSATFNAKGVAAFFFHFLLLLFLLRLHLLFCFSSWTITTLVMLLHYVCSLLETVEFCLPFATPLNTHKDLTVIERDKVRPDSLNRLHGTWNCTTIDIHTQTQLNEFIRFAMKRQQ